MQGLLVMSAKERERLKIFERVKHGELQQKEAATLCQLEYRYLRRLYQRYCKHGDRGLVHQGRRRPSNRAYAAQQNDWTTVGRPNFNITDVQKARIDLLGWTKRRRIGP